MPEKLKVLAPFDHQLIKEYDLDDAQAIDHKLATARRLADDVDGRLPLPERMAILEKAADIVEQRIEEFAKQAAHEGGKPLVDSRIELVRAVNGIREGARAVNQLTGREIPMNLNAASLNRMAYTMREPRGVVVAISAFNHPFNLIVHQVVPAIAVGCPVIVKPAGTTPISCDNLINCLYEAGLPKEWCQMTLCDIPEAQKLVTDERVNFLTFIGSAKVGWMLRSSIQSGAHCALEHGGAAPVIVEADADIDDALPLLAKGGLYHAGQVCVSVQRIFTHESKVDEISNGLVELAQKLVVGDPLDEKTDIGPLILEKEVDRVDQWVQEAIAGGGKLLTGGKKIGTTCYEPTIILNPPHDAKVSTEEIFGPVICIFSYTDRKEAIKLANNVPFSFQAAIFTKNLDVAFDTVKRLKAKTVMINDHTAFRVDWMPFGGEEKSGLGVGGILPAMEEMTSEKMFVLRSSVL